MHRSHHRAPKRIRSVGKRRGRLNKWLSITRCVKLLPIESTSSKPIFAVGTPLRPDVARDRNMIGVRREGCSAPNIEAQIHRICGTKGKIKLYREVKRERGIDRLMVYLERLFARLFRSCLSVPADGWVEKPPSAEGSQS
jgi:hypothetical protein